MVQEISGGIESYDKFVRAAPIVLVDFYANWCGPCRMIAPRLEVYESELEADGSSHKGIVAIGKVNVDSEVALARANHISAMPTFLVYKNSEPFKKVVGANERAIRAAVKEALEDPERSKAEIVQEVTEA